MIGRFSEFSGSAKEMRMGIEYALRFASPGPATVSVVLQRLPAARELPPPASGFELRADGSTDGMPDASVRPAPDGACFCDYGGRGQEFLGLVVARLVRAFGTVAVAELE
jgi:hypothetical protein